LCDGAKNIRAYFKAVTFSYLNKLKDAVHSQRLCFNISWQEPFILKLFHRIKRLKLTPRQETVILLYTKGEPQQIIAYKLNLSVNTVKEHIKNICERLKVGSRGDLIERILCD
jgi:DNA-binding NarL/FixJ family response regulator